MKKIVFLFFLVFSLVCCKGNKEERSTFNAFGTSFSDLDLEKYTRSALNEDFDILIKALKEAHTGLYWYSTERQFDSVVTMQKEKIKDSLNILEFYNIVAPIIAFTKEDHCDIHLSEEVSEYLKERGKYLPLSVISLRDTVYILNNLGDDYELRRYRLSKINGRPISAIYNKIFETFASDGFIESSKIRWLDGIRFSREYAKVIEQTDSFEIEVEGLNEKNRKTYKIKATDWKALKQIDNLLKKEEIFHNTNIPASFEMTGRYTALLTINTFDNSRFRDRDMDFKIFISDVFKEIDSAKIENLIIDIRENGGGTEGNEDYLFAYLTDKDYRKYKYVELSAFSYSFYQYTDYNNSKDQKEFEKDLKEEHYLADDGRILRKPGVEKQEELKENPFLGNVYVLTSGWTYSGGAEFANLMRQHTDAVFVGEEVGGGYYGNTSGYSLELRLPHSKLKVDIPILRFVMDVEGLPFGRGALPDYDVQPTIEEYLKGNDIQLEFVNKLISNSECP
ncbi:S41 family peptidase [Sinomicrobium kalidii]|uniref:S41 family peptidase n=1 Tax=Sinomicrobium kalidii TaxID=2900738 RepID=UPI001E2F7C7A|nr:S41 family peptidase [Sinomicrobium kalidii]UGU14454.1 S41 family peptidase [Sinomicrobium kalidii]